MDPERLAAELIRALRGKRSQAAFSRRLGFSTNVVHTWEAGRRWPTASGALWAAERAGVDVTAALTRFYRTPPQWLTVKQEIDRAWIARLLSDLRGRTAIGDIAQRAGRTRFAVARWLKGDAEPRLPDFLRMIEATSLRVLDFVAAFVDPERLPSIADTWRELQAGRRAAFHLPWSHAVMRVIELEQYRRRKQHTPGFIAAQLGISLEEERQCLEALRVSGQLSWDGTHYQVSDVRLVDTRHDPQAGRALKIWWARRALERLEQDREGLFSYNLFTVSERDYQRLRQLHLDYFRELRSIVAKSEPSERVVLAHVQLLPLAGGDLGGSEPPPAPPRGPASQRGPAPSGRESRRRGQPR